MIGEYKGSDTSGVEKVIRAFVKKAHTIDHHKS